VSLRLALGFLRIPTQYIVRQNRRRKPHQGEAFRIVEGRS